MLGAAVDKKYTRDREREKAAVLRNLCTLSTNTKTTYYYIIHDDEVAGKGGIKPPGLIGNREE